LPVPDDFVRAQRSRDIRGLLFQATRIEIQLTIRKKILAEWPVGFSWCFSPETAVISGQQQVGNFYISKHPNQKLTQIP
jgi:hypothetical protein